MKNLLLIIIVLLSATSSYSKENLNIDDYQEIEQSEGDGLLLEAQTFGLISTFLMPSRVASFSYLFSSGISIKIEPIIGIGTIAGYGSSFAVHFGDNRYDDGLRFGIRYAVANINATNLTVYNSSGIIEDAGFIHEFYGDLLSYYKISHSWRWHWGLSIGRGITSVGNRSDLGDVVETGGTFRLEVGIGKLLFE